MAAAGLLAALCLSIVPPGGAAPTGAQSTARGAKTVRFKVISASGFYPKMFTVRGKRAGDANEITFAQFEHPGRGRNFTKFPDEWVVIDNVAEIYLRADIEVLYQTPLSRPLMRSDDPALSDYLYYKSGDEWIRRPSNTQVDVFDDEGCSIRFQSWEDGGGLDQQDFFFEIANDCAIASR